MKLNVGCGTDIREGWTNLDIRELPGVDIVCNMSEGIPLEDGSVDEILAQDILEHFPLDQTDQILSEWNRILRDHGYIRIEVPDLETQVKDWLCGKTVPIYEGQDPTERFSQIVYGKQDYPGNFHYQMFDRIRLSKILAKNGFEVEDFYVRGRALGVTGWKA